MYRKIIIGGVSLAGLLLLLCLPFVFVEAQVPASAPFSEPTNHWISASGGILIGPYNTNKTPAAGSIRMGDTRLEQYDGSVWTNMGYGDTGASDLTNFTTQAEILAGTNTWSGTNTFTTIIVTNFSGPGMTNFVTSDEITNFITAAEVPAGLWTTNGTGIAYTGGTVRVDTGDLTVSNDVDVIGGVTSATLNVSGAAVAATLQVDAEPYAAGWSSDLTVPTKDDLYTKIQTLGGLEYLTDPNTEYSLTTDEWLSAQLMSRGGSGYATGPYVHFFYVTESFQSDATYIHDGWNTTGAENFGFMWVDSNAGTTIDTAAYMVAITNPASWLVTNASPYLTYSEIGESSSPWLNWQHATVTFETNRIYGLVMIGDAEKVGQSHNITQTGSSPNTSWPGSKWVAVGIPAYGPMTSFTHTDWEGDKSIITTNDMNTKQLAIVSRIVDPAAGTNTVSKISLEPTISPTYTEASETLQFGASPPSLQTGDGVAATVTNTFYTASPLGQYFQIPGTIHDSDYILFKAKNAVQITGIECNMYTLLRGKTWDFYLYDSEQTVLLAEKENFVDSGTGNEFKYINFDVPYTVTAGDTYKFIRRQQGAITLNSKRGVNGSTTDYDKTNFLIYSWGYGTLAALAANTGIGQKPNHVDVPGVAFLTGASGYQDSLNLKSTPGISYSVTNGVSTVSTWVDVPASASATGLAGQRAYASGFLYICVATDTWERTAIATW